MLNEKEHEKAQVFVIGDGGKITALYNDDLADLGEQDVRRASDVRFKAGEGWYIQLSEDERNRGHMNEVIARGFARRADAIAYEVACLMRHVLKGEYWDGNVCDGSAT